MVVKIEQRLQDKPRFLFIPMDEAAVLGLPILVGLLSKDLILWGAAAFALWSLWKWLKGEGGLEILFAAAYWYLPFELAFFRPLPDSAVSVWEG